MLSKTVLSTINEFAYGKCSNFGTSTKLELLVPITKLLSQHYEIPRIVLEGHRTLVSHTITDIPPLLRQTTVPESMFTGQVAQNNNRHIAQETVSENHFFPPKLFTSKRSNPSFALTFKILHHGNGSDGLLSHTTT